MSVSVDLEALGGRLGEYGTHAYLLTVSEGNRPHVVSVDVRLDGDVLTASVGRTTAANLAARPDATFLWSPPGGTGDYSLIVDGTAVDDPGEGRVAVRPTRAVLHRVAGATTDGPTCVPVSTT